MRTNLALKNRKMVTRNDLTKLSPIATVEPIIESRVDSFFTSMQEKYTVSKEGVYDRLYLKVRKMFLEEER